MMKQQPLAQKKGAQQVIFYYSHRAERQFLKFIKLESHEAESDAEVLQN